MTHPADGRSFAGYLPSPPDRRDYPARVFLPRAAEALPAEYSLPFEPPVYDQVGNMCCAYGLSSLKEDQEQVETGTYAAFSPGYIYGNRLPGQYMGEGMYPREALAALTQNGVPPAEILPVAGTFLECRAAYLAHQAEADQAARPQRVQSYVLCQTPADVQGALYHLGSPVLLGANVTKWFCYLVDASGMVKDEPADHFTETSPYMVGGHAMIIMGWRQIDGRLYWVVQNSWGFGWGAGGRCYMPADWPGILEQWAVTDRHPNGRKLRLTMGSRTMQLVWPEPDGTERVEELQMDVEPVIVAGRTLVPPRFVADGLTRLLATGSSPGPILPLPVTDPVGRVLYVDLVIPDPE
ncbi:MAG TPA: C1 family peptidase [Symbiobacteriaceae bacterium]|jgi:hypothetical protein